MQMHHESHKVGLHIERNRVNDHKLIVSQMDRLIPRMTGTTGKLLKATNGVELYMQEHSAVM